jgi:hypothetical protein
MDGQQPAGEFHLVVRLERAHRAGLHPPEHGGVHVRIGVAEDARQDPAGGHVDEPALGGVDHLAAAGLLVVGRPLVGGEEFGPLGEQLRAAGDDRLRRPVLGLDVGRRPRGGHAEQLPGRPAEDPLDVAVVHVGHPAGVADREQVLDPDRHRVGELLGRPVDRRVARPQEAVTGADAAADDRAHGMIEAEQQPRGANGAKDRLVGERLADGGGVEEHVVEAADGGQAGERVGRVEAPAAVGEHEQGAGIPQAAVADVPLVGLVGERPALDEMEHDGGHGRVPRSIPG